jgi:hypothetical protein
VAWGEWVGWVDGGGGVNTVVSCSGPVTTRSCSRARISRTACTHHKQWALCGRGVRRRGAHTTGSRHLQGVQHRGQGEALQSTRKKARGRVRGVSELGNICVCMCMGSSSVPLHSTNPTLRVMTTGSCTPGGSACARRRIQAFRATPRKALAGSVCVFPSTLLSNRPCGVQKKRANQGPGAHHKFSGPRRRMGTQHHTQQLCVVRGEPQASRARPHSGCTSTQHSRPKPHQSPDAHSPVIGVRTLQPHETPCRRPSI